MSGLRLELRAEELVRLARELDELAAAAASAAGATRAQVLGADADGVTGQGYSVPGVARGLHNVAAWFEQYASALGAVAGVLHAAAATFTASDEDGGRRVRHGPGAGLPVPDDVRLA